MYNYNQRVRYNVARYALVRFQRFRLLTLSFNDFDSGVSPRTDGMTSTDYIQKAAYISSLRIRSYR